VYADLQRYDDALAAFQRAIELDPNYTIARNNLKILLDERDRKTKKYSPLENFHQRIRQIFMRSSGKR
jgi:tetratricopeptide (TPR) repeat protein